MSDPIGLQAHQLHVERGGRAVLRGLSLEVPPGTWTALVGPNGAGKSTAMAALAGVLAVQSGEVSLDGRALSAWPRRERARQLAWLSQQGPMDADLIAREVVMLGRLPYHGLTGSADGRDHQATDEAMAATGCTHLASRRLSELSGGERQRLLIARALATQAAVTLMDEPCAHLDPQYRRQLMRTLRLRTQAGHAVLTAEHDLTHALQADRLVVVTEGTVRAQGAVHDRHVHRELEAVFDGAIRIERCDAGRSWAVWPVA